MFQQERLVQENQSSERRGPGELGRAGLDLWGPKAPGWKRNQRPEGSGTPDTARLGKKREIQNDLSTGVRTLTDEGAGPGNRSWTGSSRGGLKSWIEGARVGWWCSRKPRGGYAPKRGARNGVQGISGAQRQGTEGLAKEF